MTPESKAGVTPIETLLGKDGTPPMCKVWGDGVSVHWYPPGSKPGDRCFCGQRTMGKSE